MAKCDCGLEWTSLTECHCGACHRHFGGLGGFDLHRKGDACLDPATLLTEKGEPKLEYRVAEVNLKNADGSIRQGRVLAWRPLLGSDHYTDGLEPSAEGQDTEAA